MFKPDNDKLKSIVFHLLKKKPIDDYAIMWKYGKNTVSIGYPTNLTSDKYEYEKLVPSLEKTDEWSVNLTIFQDHSYLQCLQVILTEKEAMEIKWALDDLNDELLQNRLNELAEFALEEKGTQDDLLED